MEYEVKYVSGAWYTDYIGKQLTQICTEDTIYRENIVNSLYFDTADWAFSMEKASSDYLKTKVRVRWYSDIGHQSRDAPRFLEIKRKTGSKRSKKRTCLSELFNNLTADNCTKTHLQQLSILISQIEPSLQNMQLVPALYVSYHRRRFKEPYSNSRVSLDSNIRGRALSIPVAHGCRSIMLEQSVLEIKGKHPELPLSLRNPLSGLIKKAAFSKYYECFVRLSHYQQ